MFCHRCHNIVQKSHHLLLHHNSKWDILDFEDVEKDLANKLTDNDFSAILKSINAQDVLKRLKLCGCINITGTGLYPLLSSVVLEQIDISLVGNYGQFVETKISPVTIMFILDNIISSDGCSLKHITFPTPWCDYYKTAVADQFRQRYNLLCNSRGLSCSHCKASLRDNNLSWTTSGNRMFQNNVCYDCLKHFCNDCTDEDGDGNRTLNFCNSCEKDYCVDCVARTECVGLHCDEGNMCSGCANSDVCRCQQCNETRCDLCLNTCDGCKRTRCNSCVSYHRCEEDGCKKAHCEECYDGKEYDVKGMRIHFLL